MPLLEVRGLARDYGDTHALIDLDLDVERGEIFGLLGPNGAGKTTAISMICGALTRTRGSVSIAGHDLQREPMAARRSIGYVPQELAVYDEITARQNLRYFGRIYDLRGAELERRIERALALAGLEDRAEEPVKRFSGGMKRRLNIAIAVLHRPALLVLDEPTVGVDPQSRAHIFDTVRNLARDGYEANGEPVAVLYTSHYMEEVEALCERVLILDHGRRVALDRVEDLLRAHARSCLELEVSGDLSRVETALAELGTVTRRERTLILQGFQNVSSAVTCVEGCGATVERLSTGALGLENVFLELTGRQLRDKA
ncbi:MAG: ABC transporter ATP-binding protein [Planctomycetes bacterium]|nr:ABC transporter ATP-binding protein [Planctomycetota bacterium]